MCATFGVIISDDDDDNILIRKSLSFSCAVLKIRDLLYTAGCTAWWRRQIEVSGVWVGCCDRIRSASRVVAIRQHHRPGHTGANNTGTFV